MRVVLLISLLALASASNFELWKAKHGYSFKPDENEMREQIFNANIARIESYKTLDPSATYGVNQFAHLTEAEFRQNMLGLRGTDAHGCPTTTTVSTNDVPASIDWREKGAVTPVKNQGMCGSCWAFSTTGDLEGSHFIATGKLVSLSEQDLVDCDHNGDQGCNGGLPTQAMQSIITAGGIEAEADYKYEGKDATCRFDKSKVAVTISNYTCVAPDEEQMAAFIAQYGPVSIGINANTLQFYMGGIADPFEFLCSPKHLDHGVLIVGFGEENKKPYWIVKNSWGEGWGEKGYFRIIRNKNKCGVREMVSHSIV